MNVKHFLGFPHWFSTSMLVYPRECYPMVSKSTVSLHDAAIFGQAACVVILDVIARRDPNHLGTDSNPKKGAYHRQKCGWCHQKFRIHCDIYILGFTQKLMGLPRKSWFNQRKWNLSYKYQIEGFSWIQQVSWITRMIDGLKSRRYQHLDCCMNQMN